MKKIIILLALAGLVGCAPRIQTVDLIQGAESVKVYRKSDPPSSCVEIRPFTAVNGEGCGRMGTMGGFEPAYNTFKNMVVELGGNAGLIVKEVPNHPEPRCYVNAYTIDGVAYKCPPDAMK